MKLKDLAQSWESGHWLETRVSGPIPKRERVVLYSPRVRVFVLEDVQTKRLRSVGEDEVEVNLDQPVNLSRSELIFGITQAETLQLNTDDISRVARIIELNDLSDEKLRDAFDKSFGY